MSIEASVCRAEGMVLYIIVFSVFAAAVATLIMFFGMSLEEKKL